MTRTRPRIVRLAKALSTKVKTMSSQHEFVLRTVEERDIRFIRLWFTDLMGGLKSVVMSPSELESAFDEGVGFDGSSIEGFSRISESDNIAMPDPSTFQVLPFEQEEPDMRSEERRVGKELRWW